MALNLIYDNFSHFSFRCWYYQPCHAVQPSSEKKQRRLPSCRLRLKLLERFTVSLYLISNCNVEFEMYDIGRKYQRSLDLPIDWSGYLIFRWIVWLEQTQWVKWWSRDVFAIICKYILTKYVAVTLYGDIYELFKKYWGLYCELFLYR